MSNSNAGEIYEGLAGRQNRKRTQEEEARGSHPAYMLPSSKTESKIYRNKQKVNTQRQKETG